MKKLFKFILVVIMYSFIFIIANTSLPFSDSFKQLNSSVNSPGSLLFLFLNNLWICFTVYFIVTRSQVRGIRLTVYVIGVLFIVQAFMMQIETLFFGYAFDALTKIDILFIMVAELIPLSVIAPLSVAFFQNKEIHNSEVKASIFSGSTAKKVLLIGIIYLAVYMFFGYFVAWQSEELRIFYTGSPEKLSFFAQQLEYNLKPNPIIYPFQFFRGALFAAATLPLLRCMNNKKNFVIGVCLVYLCASIGLIIPNALFPDAVRIAHFYEMMSSMLLFGIITGNIVWKQS